MGFSEFFSKQASVPSGIFGRFVMSRIFDKGNAELHEFMLKLMAVSDTDHVLEIGFGTGSFLKDIATIAKNGRVEGIDFSNDRFDKIYTANAVYFWPDIKPTLRKIKKTLKPGGKLFIGFVDKEQLEKKPLSAEVFRFYTTDEIKQHLLAAGFSGGVNIISKQGKSINMHCAVVVK